MKKKYELTDPNSCMNKASDEEMTFVLLGRDPAAAVAIRAWAKERIRIGKNAASDAQIQEAFTCCESMALPAEGSEIPVKPLKCLFCTFTGSQHELIAHSAACERHPLWKKLAEAERESKRYRCLREQLRLWNNKVRETNFIDPRAARIWNEAADQVSIIRHNAEFAALPGAEEGSDGAI